MTVAILNTSEEMIEMLTLVLEREGFRVVSAYILAVKRGEVDLEAFFAEHQPSVVVWDIAPPYEPNWQLFKALRADGYLRDREIVVTTTNKRYVDELSSDGSPAHEILGKPYDLAEFADAVTSAAERAGWARSTP